MFGELEMAGLDFDPAVLEAYVGACVAIAGLVFLFNKVTSSSEYGTGRGSLAATDWQPPQPLPAEPAPSAAEVAGNETTAERPAPEGAALPESAAPNRRS